MKIAITGGPKTGKTTLALGDFALEGYEVESLDSWIDSYSWSELSEAASYLFGDDGKNFHVIEGVQVPRALRKFLKRTEDERPCDKVIFLQAPKKTQTQRQWAMGKGVLTVFNEILPELKRRGVEVEWR